MTAPSAHIPRAHYALLMAAATAGALGVIWLVAQSRHVAPDVLRSSLISFAVGSFLTFLPAVLNIAREHWGLAVLASGVGRAIVSLALAYFMGLSPAGAPSRDAMMATAAATGLVLLVEVIGSVLILSRIERQRDAARSSTPTQIPTQAPTKNVVTH